jgi:hypothetical protein
MELQKIDPHINELKELCEILEIQISSELLTFILKKLKRDRIYKFTELHLNKIKNLQLLKEIKPALQYVKEGMLDLVKPSNVKGIEDFIKGIPFYIEYAFESRSENRLRFDKNNDELRLILILRCLYKYIELPSLKITLLEKEIPIEKQEITFGIVGRRMTVKYQLFRFEREIDRKERKEDTKYDLLKMTLRNKILKDQLKTELNCSICKKDNCKDEVCNIKKSEIHSSLMIEWINKVFEFVDEELDYKVDEDMKNEAEGEAKEVLQKLLV